ncbi:LamB/YcsF family protein, partial [Micrococcus sp. HSID17228]|uniref:LamB/YcsF family protein n=1 Tax=Micrococcus sp. HSID17228 TaxID=2419507 RepID=UPI000FA41926
GSGVGLRGEREAFAARGCNPGGTLASGREPGAVLNDEDDVAARMVRLATEGVVAAVDGTDVRVDAESICLHGDTPGAVAMAAAVRRALEGAGVSIKAFA